MAPGGKLRTERHDRTIRLVHAVQADGEAAAAQSPLLPERQPGLAFVVLAVAVAIPTTALAWLSSRTVEEAGRKTLDLVDERGRPRDYCAHLESQPAKR